MVGSTHAAGVASWHQILPDVRIVCNYYYVNITATYYTMGIALVPWGKFEASQVPDRITEQKRKRIALTG